MAKNRSSPPPAPKAAALFFSKYFGGYTPGFFIKRKQYPAPASNMKHNKNKILVIVWPPDVNTLVPVYAMQQPLMKHKNVYK